MAMDVQEKPVESLAPPAERRPEKRQNEPVGVDVGTSVLYWPHLNPGEKLHPSPARLIERSISGLWHLNEEKLGLIVARHDVPYSDKPKEGCWTLFPGAAWKK